MAPARCTSILGLNEPREDASSPWAALLGDSFTAEELLDSAEDVVCSVEQAARLVSDSAAALFASGRPALRSAQKLYNLSRGIEK